MNISFDLDSTLIPSGNEFETERRSLVAKLLGIEQIRKGSKQLIEDLQRDGHVVHIYTTSLRSKNKIRWSLILHGVKVKSIITEVENQRTLKSHNINSSKYPPAFGFDLHIDDAEGVGVEADQFGFEAIIIKPSDKNWTAKIKQQVRQLSGS